MKGCEVNKDRFNIPVLFLIYNRPDLTFKAFEPIKRLKPANLFIAADGPREGVQKDKELCAQTREISGCIDWPCEVKTLFREIHLGCRTAVSDAISWFFKHVEEGIILEDDCVPHISFFRFCEELLGYYRDNNMIMAIGGNNFQSGKTRPEHGYYFSKYIHIWGWATWRRAWEHYDVDMKLWPETRDKRLLFDIRDNEKEASYWKDVFEKVYRGKVDSWDFQWLFACWIQKGLNILPSMNLVSNIGFGNDSTHTRTNSAVANLENKEIVFPLSHPAYVSRNVLADKIIDKMFFSSRPLYKKIIAKICSFMRKE